MPRQCPRFLVAVSLSLLVTIPSLLSADEAVTTENLGVRLAYRFQPNQSLYFEYSQELTMDSRKKDLQETMCSQSSAEKHLRVISVDANGNALIEPVIDRARLSHNLAGGPTTTFDSADGTEKCLPEYRPILNTVGKPLVRVKFAPTGKVLEATPLKGGNASAEGLENDPMLNFLIVFPVQPVKLGDTWKDEFNVAVSVTEKLRKDLKLRREYRLTKLDGPQAVIELKTTAISPINEPSVELQIMLRLLTGTIVFDHQAGQLVSTKLQVDREVINALGPGSLVHTTMTQSERIIPNPRVARRETSSNP